MIWNELWIKFIHCYIVLFFGVLTIMASLVLLSNFEQGEKPKLASQHCHPQSFPQMWSQSLSEPPPSIVKELKTNHLVLRCLGSFTQKWGPCYIGTNDQKKHFWRDSFAFKLNQKLSFHESIATFSQSKILVFCRNPLEAVQFCPLCRSVKSLCHVSSVLYFHPKTIFPRFEPCDETVVRPLPAFSLIIRHSIVFPQPRLFFDQTPSLSLQIRWNIDFLSSDWKCSIVVVTPRIIATKSG